MDQKLDLMALTETWTKSDSLKSIGELCPRGYGFFHVPRSGRQGGGVGLVYSKSLSIRKQNNSIFTSFESMEVLLQSPKYCVRVIVIYRLHPKKKLNVSMSTFFDEFSQLLGCLTVSSGKLILLGDFNFHVDEPEKDPHAACFLELRDLHNLSKHVTRSTHRSSHTLDLVITRKDENIIADCNVYDPCLSDHYVVICNLSLDRLRPVRVEKTYHKLRSCDMDAFHSDLSSSKLFLSPADSVGELCDQYNSQLSQLVEAYAPLRTRVLTSHPSAPWYSTEIASEKTKRRKFERRWRKSQLHIDHQLFEDQCILVRNMVKNAKQSYYSSIISENALDQKALFNTVDRLLYHRTDRQYPSCESSLELCNNFSDFFVNKITKIQTELPTF